MPVRTFVALELSRPVKEGILDLIETLRRRGVRASWSGEATLHLTLKFLGDVDEELLPDVIGAVRRASARVPSFAFELGSLGAFPSPRRPRVLWVGIDAPDALWDLVIRNPRDAEGANEHLATLSAPNGRVVIRETRIMKSTLRPAGAIHEVVAAVALGGEEEGVSA